jgi:Ca2+-binding EF-hand superfamily protein
VAGLELSEEEAGALFLLVDEDKSGVLTFDEVACLLEHGAKDFEGHRYACRV